MYNWRGYKVGRLVGTQYHFPKRGDGLPMHQHMEEDKHNVIVLNGSCDVYGLEKSWCYRLGPGSIFHFQDHEYPHEIAALEDNTVILNLCIWGDKFIHLKQYADHYEEGVAVCESITIPLEDINPKRKKK